MQIQISWLLQKPTDLDLHCLQRQGISGFSRTRVNRLYIVVKNPGQLGLMYSVHLSEFFGGLRSILLTISIMTEFNFIYLLINA